MEQGAYDSNRLQDPSFVHSDPLNPQPSLNDICYDIAVLQEFGRQGSWRSILEKITQARKLSLLHKPHEHLTYLAYNVFALAKLRRYGEAAEELETLGDLESPKYRYESHNLFYSGKSGSMIPFSLRWLHAELPHRLGRRQETLDRLYKLFDFVQSKIAIGNGEKNGNAQFVGSENKPFLGAESETLIKSPVETVETPGTIKEDSEKKLGDPEKTLETQRGGYASAVPFPFTSSSADEEGVGVVSPVKISENGPFRDMEFGPNSSTGEEGGGVEIGFESLKLDESGNDKNSRINSADQEGRTPNSLDGGDFGDPLASKASPGSKNEERKIGFSFLQWQRRQELVINSILGHHMSQKDYTTCMMWLVRLLERYPSDPFLLSKVGYVQLQMGDLNGAKTMFLRIEAMVDKGQVSRPSSSIELKNLVNRNKALEHLVAKDFTAAIREYEEALDRDPADMVATNNKALCLMYSRDLLGSIKVIENALERAPVVMLNENVVLNLCSMYELAYVNNVETKRTLSSWIVQIAPEDFDLSCTRL